MQIKGQKRPTGLQFLREGGYDFNESKELIIIENSYWKSQMGLESALKQQKDRI